LGCAGAFFTGAFLFVTLTAFLPCLGALRRSPEEAYEKQDPNFKYEA